MQEVIARPKNGDVGYRATKVLGEMLMVAGEQPIRVRFNRSKQNGNILVRKMNCLRKPGATRFVDNLKTLNQTMQAGASIGCANVPICFSDGIRGRNKDRVREVPKRKQTVIGKPCRGKEDVGVEENSIAQARGGVCGISSGFSPSFRTSRRAAA